MGFIGGEVIDKAFTVFVGFFSCHFPCWKEGRGMKIECVRVPQ